MLLDTPLTAQDCRVLPLALSDERIPALLTACQDFFIKHYGLVPGPQALEILIADLTPDKRTRDLVVLGIEDSSSRLVGALLLIRDWDRRRQWCLRTLILTPDRRRHGLGAAVYRSVSTWAKSQGAAAMLVGVLTANAMALRFWQRLGFQEIRRQHFPDLGDAVDLEHRFVDIRAADVSKPGILLRRMQATTQAPSAPIFGSIGPTTT